MTSHTRVRYTNAARHIAGQLARTATTLENAPLTCATAIANNTLVAVELRRLQRIILGDIGEGAEEWEVEPVTVPAEVPAEPSKVPA